MEKIKNWLKEKDTIYNYYFFKKPIKWFSLFMTLMIPFSFISVYLSKYIINEKLITLIILVVFGLLSAILAVSILQLENLYKKIILSIVFLIILIFSYFMYFTNLSLFIDTLCLLLLFTIIGFPIILIVKVVTFIKKDK